MLHHAYVHNGDDDDDDDDLNYNDGEHLSKRKRPQQGCRTAITEGECISELDALADEIEEEEIAKGVNVLKDDNDLLTELWMEAENGDIEKLTGNIDGEEDYDNDDQDIIMSDVINQKKRKRMDADEDADEDITCPKKNKTSDASSSITPIAQLVPVLKNKISDEWIAEHSQIWVGNTSTTQKLYVENIERNAREKLHWKRDPVKKMPNPLTDDLVIMVMTVDQKVTTPQDKSNVSKYRSEIFKNKRQLKPRIINNNRNNRKQFDWNSGGGGGGDGRWSTDDFGSEDMFGDPNRSKRNQREEAYDPFNDWLKQDNATNTKKSYTQNKEGLSSTHNSSTFMVAGERALKFSKQPVIRVFGITEAGNSVAINVYNFQPYLSIKLPLLWWMNFREECGIKGITTVKTQSVMANLCKVIKNHFNTYMKTCADPKNKSSSSLKQYMKLLDHEDYVTDVIWQHDVVSIYGYQTPEEIDEDVPYFKIVCVLPAHVTPLRSYCQNGIIINLNNIRHQLVVETYESNYTFDLRFMTDVGLRGCTWVTIKAGTYQLTIDKESRCQIEIDALKRSFVPLPTTGEWIKVAPIRTLSFDIEALFGFADEADNQIIQISNLVVMYTAQEGFVKRKTVFTVGIATASPDYDTVWCKNEVDLLIKWRDSVLIIDPDMIEGHNFLNYDLQKILKRAEFHGIKNFPYFNRVINELVTIKENKFENKAQGMSITVKYNVPGRTMFDLLKVAKTAWNNLRAHNLNALAFKFLGEQKDDVSYSQIPILHAGTNDDRATLAKYCMRDSDLTFDILHKTKQTLSYIYMARQTGVPFMYLVERGASIKVTCDLYSKCVIRRFMYEGAERQFAFLIPVISDFVRKEMFGEYTGKATFDGAIVIDPLKAFYEVPIATLDFASLYPSIMMAHNLCYSTWIRNKKVPPHWVKDVDYIITPHNDWFVKPKHRKGILPIMLFDLIDARNAVKKSMSQFKEGSFEYEQYNLQQMAIKVCANSIYGFTGATVGSLPCTSISASVTGFGREMLQMTQKLVLEKYTKANGYEHDAVIIYGDTDSVMVKFGTDSLARAMELGREAAKYVSSHFINPIKLEFEKCYWPYLLITKKRYAGLFWTQTDKPKYMDAKGLESKRRDNCLMVSGIIEKCLNIILYKKDFKGAVEYCKNIVRRLHSNQMDMSELVITKKYSKEDYKNMQPHIEVLKKLRKRGTNKYALGDRIAYVFTRGDPKLPLSLRAEDPLYAMQNNEQPDIYEYLRSLEKPLGRLFTNILKGGVDSIFRGDHVTQCKHVITLPSISIAQSQADYKRASFTPASNLVKSGFGDVLIGDNKAIDIVVAAKRNGDLSLITESSFAKKSAAKPPPPSGAKKTPPPASPKKKPKLGITASQKKNPLGSQTQTRQLGILAHVRKLPKCFICECTIVEEEEKGIIGTQKQQDDESMDRVCMACIKEGLPGEIYQSQSKLAKMLNWEVNRLRQQCEDCQGGPGKIELCQTTDCRYFYRRFAYKMRSDTMNRRVYLLNVAKEYVSHGIDEPSSIRKGKLVGSGIQDEFAIKDIEDIIESDKIYQKELDDRKKKK